MLEAKVNKHAAINKTYNDGLAALTKHDTEGQPRFDVKRANLERQLVKIDTDRQTFDRDITTQRAILRAGFETDTMEYNQMNTALLNYKSKYNRQGTLLKTKKRTVAHFYDDAETARSKFQIHRTCYANQIVDIFNSHLKGTWVMEQRSGLGGECDLSLPLVNLVTSMLVNRNLINKKEAWRSVNRAANNQENNYLFETAEYKITTTQTTEWGIITYKLNPEFLGQLCLEPQPHKFNKMQYWHLTRESVLLCTMTERKAEHQKRMSDPALSATRKTNENA